MALATTERKSNPMPIWLSIPVILLCLAAGGYIIRLYVISDPISRDVKLLGDSLKTTGMPNMPFLQPNRWNGGPGGGNPGRPRLSTPYVNPNAQKNRWDIKTDTAEEWVILNDRKEITTFRLLYNSDAFMPAEIRERFNATEALLKNIKAVPEASKLTANQQQILRNLIANPKEMAISAKEKSAFKEAFVNYLHAPDASHPGMEPALFKALDDLAARSTSATITAAGKRVEEINQIVTPEMWKQSAGVK